MCASLRLNAMPHQPCATTLLTFCKLCQQSANPLLTLSNPVLALCRPSLIISNPLLIPCKPFADSLKPFVASLQTYRPTQCCVGTWPALLPTFHTPHLLINALSTTCCRPCCPPRLPPLAARPQFQKGKFVTSSSAHLHASMYTHAHTHKRTHMWTRTHK